MAWRLKGTYFENCNCNVACPCTVSGLTLRADNERCRVVLVFHVDAGEIEGVDVSNRSIAVLADTPPQMLDGKWRVGVFMDEAASPKQEEKLGAVFSGKLGGPMAALAPLIGEMMGMEVMPIEYKNEGRRHSAKIGTAAEIEVEDFASPTGEITKLVGVFHPANSTLAISKATKSRVKAFGLEFSNDGKSGASAPFSWSA